MKGGGQLSHPVEHMVKDRLSFGGGGRARVAQHRAVGKFAPAVGHLAEIIRKGRIVLGRPVGPHGLRREVKHERGLDFARMHESGVRRRALAQLRHDLRHAGISEHGQDHGLVLQGALRLAQRRDIAEMRVDRRDRPDAFGLRRAGELDDDPGDGLVAQRKRAGRVGQRPYLAEGQERQRKHRHPAGQALRQKLRQPLGEQVVGAGGQMVAMRIRPLRQATAPPAAGQAALSARRHRGTRARGRGTTWPQ